VVLRTHRRKRIRTSRERKAKGDLKIFFLEVTVISDEIKWSGRDLILNEDIISKVFKMKLKGEHSRGR
jgi:hypothetical protein